MTAAGRQDATGGASALELFATISDPTADTCQVNGTVSGWIYSRPFTITVDPLTPSEEKMLCSVIVGSNPATITILTRGYDDTVPTTHGQGAKVTHTLPAAIIMDLERHVYDTTEDDHSQYFNATRHATPANHEFGVPGNLFAFGAGATDPADVGTAASPGGGTAPARDDHIHKIGAGAINAFGMLSTGLVGLVGDITAVGSAAAAGTALKFARADHVHPLGADGSIPFAKIGIIPAGAISGLKLTDATVTQAKLIHGPYGKLSLAGQAPTVAASTLKVLNFDTTEYDDDGVFTSSTRFTVPAGWGGVWTIDACIGWPADSSLGGSRRYIALRANGSTILDEQSCPAVATAGIGTSTSTSITQRLVATDYIEVTCRQDSPGTATLGSSGVSHFSATFIRPT